jgi:hypothetical protein
MNDKKFEKLLNKEAEKYVRKNKDAVMKSCGVEIKKQKPAILSALPAVAAVAFIAAFAVICYIPVALKNNGTSSGTEIAETTDTDGVYTQDFGTETSVTEETETTTKEVKKKEDIAEYDERKEFFSNRNKLYQGTELSDDEIKRMIDTINNTRNGINWNYINKMSIAKTADEQNKVIDEEIDFVYLPITRKHDYLNIADQYKKMNLQTVCKIINESKSFEEVLEKFAENDKFFGSYGYFSHSYYCSYDLISDDETVEEYIGIYPESKRMFFCTISDNTSKTRKWFDLSDTELEKIYNGSFILTKETIRANLISWYPADRFVEYINRERNGEKLSEAEIDELTEYIDNNYFGIDLKYARASDDERKAIAEERGVDEATMNAYILLWTDAENIGKLEYYGYPKMTIQKICDIINESENFDEIIRKIGETDKFLSQVWQKTTGEYGYRYDFRSSEDNCYEYIDVYPADNSIMYHKVINDRNSKEYHYNYAVYLWNKDIEEGENHHITTDQIKDNLRLWNNDF